MVVRFASARGGRAKDSDLSFRVLAGALALGLCFAPVAWAQTGDAPGRQSAAPPARTLIEAWLTYPRLADVAAPFVFIQSDAATSRARELRSDVVDELDDLLWRLRDSGYAELSKSVEQWQSRLKALQTFRVPGRWDVAWLLAHPNENPPLRRLDGLGSCAVPDWVEVWDRHGVRRLSWRSVDTLSNLLEQTGIEGAPDGRIAVVTPEGSVDHFGVQAWNFRHHSISPGMRVVAALPLKGEAFPWLRDALARFLSYVPAGSNCRAVALNRGPRS